MMMMKYLMKNDDEIFDEISKAIPNCGTNW